MRSAVADSDVHPMTARSNRDRSNAESCDPRVEVRVESLRAASQPGRIMISPANILEFCLCAAGQAAKRPIHESASARDITVQDASQGQWALGLARFKRGSFNLHGSLSLLRLQSLAAAGGPGIARLTF